MSHATARAAAMLVAVMLLLAPGCTRLPTGPVLAPDPPERGITFVDWTADGYGTETAAASLAALVATGANTVTVLVTAYQADRAAAQLRADDPRTPTPDAVRRIVSVARTHGLRVAIKPHVDLDDGTWRGAIVPPDPSAWFRSYRAYVLSWAALARSVGAERFVIGTELGGTLIHEAEWRRTIAEVRAAFDGEVVYAASWDEAAKVPFWDALDRVGVDAYFPVADRADAGRLELLAGWQPWLERLRLLHRQTGRSILITEIGYRSVDGAGLAPYEFGSGATLDLGEQADLFWAALEATADQPYIHGLTWWNWPADGSGGPRNTDYTPSGKPAASELSSAWGGA